MNRTKELLCHSHVRGNDSLLPISEVLQNFHLTLPLALLVILIYFIGNDIVRKALSLELNGRFDSAQQPNMLTERSRSEQHQN